LSGEYTEISIHRHQSAGFVIADALCYGGANRPNGLPETHQPKGNRL